MKGNVYELKLFTFYVLSKLKEYYSKGNKVIDWLYFLYEAKLDRSQTVVNVINYLNRIGLVDVKLIRNSRTTILLEINNVKDFEVIGIRPRKAMIFVKNES